MQNTTTEPNEYQKAAGVARFVEVADISLLSMGAELLVPKAQALQARKVHLKLDKSTSFSFDEPSMSLAVTVKVVCTVSSDTAKKSQVRSKKGSSPGADIVRIACAFRLAYSFNVKAGPPEALREELFTAFANVNGIFNAWPYIRELVQTTATRMGLPPLVLPVYRVGPQATRAPGALQKEKADSMK